ncbi:hypothetical protein AB4369_08975 [Vibrio sp. 10N.261.49.A5]|uniref:Polysaccharide biosynthesis protein n=1 Tax=Vibrio tasmaniensis 1F-267 TaxID=1191324 RepID=A0ABX3B2E1_9VIBR|nr:hypothetical protein [Vibrio tasmaniensis]OEF43738.1 hypothetical protein A163_01360 [Vibrio tasmaniensis 1F-267]
MSILKLGVLLTRALEVFLSFLLIKLASDILSPEEFAKMGLFIAITQGATWFLISPIQNYLLVNSKNAFENQKLFKLIKWELAYSLLIGVVSYCFLLNSKINSLESIDSTLFFLIFTCSIGFGIVYQTLIPALNIIERRKQFILASLLFSIFNFCLPIFLTNIYKPIFEFWIAGIVLAQGLVFIVFLLYNEFNGEKREINVDSFSLSFRGLIKFSIPLSFAVAFQWFNSQGYRLVLENYIALEQLGLFFMGFSFCGRFLNAAEKVFSSVFLPDLYNAPTKDSKKQQWLEYIIKIGSVHTLLLIFLLIFGKYIYSGFISESYADGLLYLYYGAMFDYFRCLLNAVFQYNLVVNKNKVQLIVNSMMSIILAIVLYKSITFSLTLVNISQLMCVIIFLCLVCSFFYNLKGQSENS